MGRSLFFAMVLGASALWAQSDALKAPAPEAPGVVRIQMLARVGASSISTRSLYLFVCLKTPQRCTGYSKFVSRDLGIELQEYLIVKMAFEDNSIFKTVLNSESTLLKKQSLFEKNHPELWRRLKKDVEMEDLEARSLFDEILVFEALLSKQESLESWIQQLRSRFRVQIFNQNAT